MMDEAIQKINAEIEKEKNNSYVQVVGQFLLDCIAENPSAAEKIVDKDKTILKSLDAMRKEAQKKKVGNCAMFTPQEGFAIVLKYFGLDAKQAVTPKVEAPVLVPRPQPHKVSQSFDVSLEDLL